MTYEVNPDGRADPVPGTEPPEDEPLTAVLTRLANQTALADLKRPRRAAGTTRTGR